MATAPTPAPAATAQVAAAQAQVSGAVKAAEGAVTTTVDKTVTHGTNFIAHHAMTVALGAVGFVALVVIVGMFLAFHH